MKKLLLIAMMALVSMGWMTAQDKKDNSLKTTVFATDIRCENCSTKIMNNVPSLGKGIKDVQVSVANKTVTVTYDTRKNSDDRIVKGLKSINVDAAPVQPCAKDKPACCKEKQAAEQPKQECGKKDCD